MKTINAAVSVGFAALLQSSVAHAQQSVQADIHALTMSCSQSDIAQQSSQTYIPRQTAEKLAEKEKRQNPLYTLEEAKKLIEFALNEYLCGLQQEGIKSPETTSMFQERLVSFLDNTISDGQFSHDEKVELSMIAREIKKFIQNSQTY